jgi:hypothetical protein
MNEPTRNMLGFMFVPTLLGAIGIFAASWYRKPRPSFLLILASLGGLAASGFLGNNSIKLPAKWFLTATRAEAKPIPN